MASDCQVVENAFVSILWTCGSHGLSQARFSGCRMRLEAGHLCLSSTFIYKFWRTTEEIKTVIKSLPTKNVHCQMVSLQNSTRFSKKELIWIFLKLFHITEREGKLTNCFYKCAITLITKLHKDFIKKEDYGPISLMNIDAKILNKILANRIQEHIREIIHHNQVCFIPKMQGWFNIQKSVNVTTT